AFISYRSLDTRQIAGRVYDRLEREFSKNEIFFDVDTIPFGVDFKQHISSAVSSSAAVLVLVGEKWLNPWKRSLWPFGSKLKEDFVQLEIESALDLDVPIMPLLVDNVAMPHVENLPNSMVVFVSLNAAVIRSGRDFNKDMDLVLDTVRSYRNQFLSRKAG